ncbi:MAG: site-2 protease family protein, partial [Vicinamibacterales bacterium]
MNLVTVVGVIVVAIVSITSHEAAHGFVADRLGDPTAREHGRLTLNPIAHIDLFFTILLPLILILSRAGFIFGGAKPVPVTVSRLRRPRRDWALVGAAGPAMNVLIAVGLTGVLSVGTHLGLADPSSSLAEILALGIFLNALLAVFNLIPIPPLDG